LCKKMQQIKKLGVDVDRLNKKQILRAYQMIVLA